MYRRILVTLDGSPAAEEAIPHALAQARAFGAELLLLRVLPTLLPLHLSSAERPATASPDGADVDERVPEDERDARRYLEAVAETMRDQGVGATSHVRRGPVVATILDEARAVPADLLVLAAHGASVIPRPFVGRIAAQVVRRAPCPVLLVRANPAPARRADRVRSFAADAARYGPLVQRPLGLRTVAVDRIVGSVGRAHELRADFLPRHSPRGDVRYRRVRAALERGEILPPVELYKLGYNYYVLDGNHRVAAARALGQKDIDAVVTEFLPLDDAAAQQVFVERRAFEQATGLTRIGATHPGHYPRLAELIRAYAAGEGIADLREAARRWYERVYRPMAAQLRRAQLTRLFPGERTADLVVHLADLRAAEEERMGRPVSWEEALATMLTRYRSCQRHARLRLPGLQRLLAPRKQRARPAEQAQPSPGDARMRGPSR